MTDHDPGRPWWRSLIAATVFLAIALGVFVWIGVYYLVRD